MNTASWPIGVSRVADKAESTHLAAPEGPGALAACSRACFSPRGRALHPRSPGAMRGHLGCRSPPDG